jgi:hypothetical protein
VNERTQAEIDLTLDVLRPLVLNLRHRGYDARVWVEDRGGGTFTVEIRVNVPSKGVPLESVPVVAPDR